jgi:hypothetical protein
VAASDGRPVAGARIAVERAEEPVPEMMYVTGEDGTVQIGLPKGHVVLRVFAHGKSSRAELWIGSDSGQTYAVHVDAP